MTANQIAKNVLLDHTCLTCKFGGALKEEIRPFCKHITIKVIEEVNEDRTIEFEACYPEENTCENWEEFPKLELNIKTVKLGLIGPKKLNITWTKEAAEI